MIRIPYYPGCTIQTSAKNFEISGLAVAKKLGIELIEISNWNCCGVFPSLVADNLMSYLAPIRILNKVQEMNPDVSRVITFCSMCYHTLKRAALFVKDQEKLEKINLYLEQEKDVIGGAKGGYRAEIEVLDFLEFLRDKICFEKIAKKVIVPLTGLKVATYYGCLVLRPSEIAIDNPENPTILEDLLEILGADVVDNPNRTQCCGSYHTVDRKEIVTKLTYDNLRFPIINGADIIVTCCPLCAFNLEFRQKEVKKIHKDFKQIPIVYYTQLMAIAFGLESQTHGFDSNFHLIDPKPIIEAIFETE